MILYGQTIIKFFSGLSENQNKKKTYEAVLYVSLVIAFGLVPSIIILVLIETNHKEIILFVFQMIWLVISIIAYLILGTVGNILSIQKLIKNSDFVEGDRKKKIS
jgi:presenilin-like A22 family membrane protease